MFRVSTTILLLSASTQAIAQARLPHTAAPVSYDIRIEPDAQAMRFTGSETIVVDVKAATRTLVLNVAELRIASATLDGRATRHAVDEAQQRLTITLPTAARPGRHRLALSWTGTINTTAAGLFAIDYQDDDGTARRMLATQFEAPDARRFAPVWDEPAFKAKFTLSAVSPADQTAFSNMPVASVQSIAGNRKLWRFGETPIMSSYLLFLGIGDVERKTVMAGKTEIGVITRRGVVDRGDYALSAAKRLLAYYNDYFGQPYPLPKLDMIAGPGSSQFFSAMENWGAIFYFEPSLLFDPARATVSDRQRIYTVVAHEMAHQWFGDLVTMRWWDDLWLNEGFASWMENKASAELNPEWQAAAGAVASDRELAMRLDATAATHPIIRRLDTVDQIGESFDAISYQKGQAVIGMLESVVGPDRFRAGVRSYMAKYRYSNTVTDQLWAEVAAASGRDVAPFMHDFTLQGGVPLIRVDGVRCVGGQTVASLSQARFGLDAASRAATQWRVPVTLSTLGGATTSLTVRGATAQPARTAGCAPLIVNPGKGGYFRVRYDDASHAALTGAFARLPLADQLGTLGDDFALALSGDQPLDRYTAMVAAAGRDASPLVWQSVGDQMERLIETYAGTPLAEPLDARVRALLAPALTRVGIAPRADESPLETNLRERLFAVLGGAGDPTLVAAARRYVAGMRDGTPIPPSILTAMLKIYAANATADEWQALLAMARAERSPVVRAQYISLLGAARDPALARQALELVKADGFTAPQRAALLAAIAVPHPVLAFDFATANSALVNSLLETSTRAGFIVQLASRAGDAAVADHVLAWANANLPETSRGPARRTANTIRNRAAIGARLEREVGVWVKG